MTADISDHSNDAIGRDNAHVTFNAINGTLIYNNVVVCLIGTVIDDLCGDGW